MTIDDRLAFGEYVSIPIRTEKTAEEKLEMARAYIKKEIAVTEHILATAPRNAYKKTSAVSCRQAELKRILEYLDT